MWYFNISIDECLIWKSKTWFQTRLNFFFDSVMNEGPERLFEAHSGHFDSLLLNITISLIPLDDCFIWYKVMVGLILTKAMVTYTHLFSLSCHWLQVHIIIMCTCSQWHYCSKCYSCSSICGKLVHLCL